MPDSSRPMDPSSPSDPQSSSYSKTPCMLLPSSNLHSSQSCSFFSDIMASLLGSGSIFCTESSLACQLHSRRSSSKASHKHPIPAGEYCVTSFCKTRAPAPESLDLKLFSPPAFSFSASLRRRQLLTLIYSLSDIPLPLRFLSFHANQDRQNELQFLR